MSIFVRRQWVSIAEWECPRRWEAAKAQEDEEVKQGGLGSESFLSRVLRAITCLGSVCLQPWNNANGSMTQVIKPIYVCPQYLYFICKHIPQMKWFDHGQSFRFQVDPGGSPDCGLCGVRNEPHPSWSQSKQAANLLISLIIPFLVLELSIIIET